MKLHSFSCLRSLWRKIRLFFRYFRRDMFSVVAYGINAPKSGQRIFIVPSSVKYFSTKFTRTDTGKVISGDWDIKKAPIYYMKKISIVYRKYSEDISWEKAGAYDNMLELLQSRKTPDGCRNLDDIKKRYAALDDLVEHLKNGGKFLSVSQMGGFREHGGVCVHIGRNGEPIFSGGGAHRLAIAQILDLNFIPAQVGVVHPQALYNGKFKEKLSPPTKASTF